MTNRRTFLTALGASILTIGAGCASDSTKEDVMAELENVTELNEEGFSGVSVTRYIDREAGVVLYDTTGTQRGGVTALPIQETKLR